MARRFYLTDVTSDCAPAASINYVARCPIGLQGAGDAEHDITKNTTDELGHSFTVEPGHVNRPDWSQGDYKGSGYFTLENGTVSFKIQLLRRTEGCGAGEIIGTSSSISSAGAQSYTVAAFDPSAGANGDRFQMRILGSNSNLHSLRWLRIDTSNAASYMEGPWDSAVGPLVWDEQAGSAASGTSVSATLYQPTNTEHTERMLIAFVLNWTDAGWQAATDVTYDGISLTLLDSYVKGDYTLEVWYLLETDFASDLEEGNTLEATFASTADQMQIAGVLLTGCQEEAPEAAAESSANNVSSHSSDITSITDAAVIVDGMATTRVAPSTLSTTESGQVKVDQVTAGADIDLGLSVFHRASAGLQTIGWTAASGTPDWTHEVVAIAPFSAGQEKLGAALLEGAATIVAAAKVSHKAAAALSGVATVTAPAKVTHKATALLSGAATVTAAAKATRSASAILNGAGSVIALADIDTSAVALLSGAGSVIASARVDYKADAILSGAGTVVAAAKVTKTFSAVLSGAATVTAVGTKFRVELGVALLEGAASLIAAAKVEHKATALLSGVGSLTATAKVEHKATALLEGTATIAALADIDTSAVALLSGAASLVASAKVTKTFDAVLSGAATIVASATMTYKAIAILTGAGTIIAAAKVTHKAAAALSGVATITAVPTKTTVELGAALLEGAATLVASAKATRSAVAVLNGAASVVAGPRVDYKATAVLTGAGTIAATAKVERKATAVLTGAATIAAIADIDTSAHAVLIGAASVIASASMTYKAAAVMTGAASVTADGTVIAGGVTHEGVATLVGVASLNAAPKMTRGATAVLSGAATIVAAGRVGILYLTALSGTKSHWGRTSATKHHWGRRSDTKPFLESEPDTKG